MATPEALTEHVRECYHTRIKALQAHAETLNIFLEMRIVAVQGNKKLSERIHAIAEGLPLCYVGKNEDDRVYSYIVGQGFIALISEFENFLVDVMSAIASKFPQKLGSETFRLSEVLELGDQETIVRVATERYIGGIMYKRASEYRKSLVDVLSAEQGFLAEKWPNYVECKARRDLGVHNGWRINETYRRKVLEVGLQPSGEMYLAPSSDYFFTSLDVIAELADNILQHCSTKFRPSGE